MIDAEAIEKIREGTASDQQPKALPNGGQGYMLPPDWVLKEVPPVDPPLSSFIKQRVIMHDAPSFIDYVNEFKSDASRVFAEPGFMNPNGQAQFGAAIDYHTPLKGGPGVANRVLHTALFQPRYSDAWNRWRHVCGRPLKQLEFCELIEECRQDIRTPDAASLLDIVRTFKATKRTDYDSLTYQTDGTVKLHYSENVDKQGSSVLPEKLLLGIPVYYRDERYEVGVWVRYSVGGGGVGFSLKLDREDLIEEAAFAGMAEKIREGVGLPLHMGALR